MQLIDSAVLETLRKSRTEGDRLFLPTVQLERTAYTKVNKVLDALGGKWSKKDRGHVFPGDAGSIVSPVIETGEMPVKNPLAFFATPHDLAVSMARDAGLDESFSGVVLEPSAGDGALVKAVLDLSPKAIIQAVEIDPVRCKTLNSLDARCLEEQADFLTWETKARIDAVVMNPPFSVPGDRLAYVKHIEKAWRHLKPGGRLVAILPGGFLFAESKTVVNLRQLVREHGEFGQLPDGCFKASGTDVRTCSIRLFKPSEGSKQTA